jgi:hypothetical protein
MSRFYRIYLPSLIAAAFVLFGLAPPEILAGVAVLGSTEVDTAFIKQYEAQVHAAFQRMGSKLRNFVRISTKMPGQDVTFPKIGKGAAKTKPRNGDVEPMNVGHSSVTATLVDRYAPEYIDKLDAIKTNIDLQRAYSEASAWALGRFADSQIVDALDEATNTSSTQLTGLTTIIMNNWVARLQNRDVPTGDGNVFAAVAPFTWAKLLSLTEFSNSQYIGPENLPFKTRMEAKYWNGVTWFAFTGLNGTSTGRKNVLWHKNAVGHAIGADISTEINYIPQKVSTLINSMLSMGAIMIDDDGIEELIVNETN